MQAHLQAQPQLLDAAAGQRVINNLQQPRILASHAAHPSSCGLLKMPSQLSWGMALHEEAGKVPMNILLDRSLQTQQEKQRRCALLVGVVYRQLYISQGTGREGAHEHVAGQVAAVQQ